MEIVLLNVFVKLRMKLEQIQVAQNMQKLFIHVTSLNYLNLKSGRIFSALFFISNQMFSPYYLIEKNSKVISS